MTDRSGPRIGSLLRRSSESLVCEDNLVLRYNSDGQRLEAATSLLHLCLIETQRVTLSGASMEVSGLILDGVFLFGILSAVLEAITGATGYSLGIRNAGIDLYGRNLPVAALPGVTAQTFDPRNPAHYSSTMRDWTARNAAVYPIATVVTVTAVGGTFSGGTLALTSCYFSI